jgi:hypothetical protein
VLRVQHTGEQAVDPEHLLDEAAVIAVAVVVDEALEAAIGVGLVACGEDFVGNVLAQQAGFFGIEHGERRIEPHAMEVLPQQSGTERVQRADGGPVGQGYLLLQSFGWFVEKYRP